MLDPDISTADARRLLMSLDNDPGGLDRRRFLQLVGWGVGAGAMAGGLGELLAVDLLPGRYRDAWASTPIGPTDGILVLIGMFGGSDGLNTVVPYTNADYYQQHGNLAIPANQVLPLGAEVGLHPSLPYLKSLYDLGQVAVVEGVGYPNPDLSHFTSMALWMYGKAGNGAPNSGWVGRWLDGLAGDELFRAVSVGQGLPLHLIGNSRRGIAIPQWGLGFGDGTDEHDLWMYDALKSVAAIPAGRGAWHDSIASTFKGVVDVGQQVAPIFAATLPDNDLEKTLTVAARLINANIGLRVVDTGFDGFDTHSSQPQELSSLLADFDTALKVFFNTLAPEFRSRVTLMTYSEFGRTSWSNDSDGTDHGTANSHFVIGPAVKGGLYGQRPSLAGLDQWDRMNFSVDFRSLYATVLDRWLGGGAATVLGGTFEQLDLYRTSPDSGSGFPPSTTAGLVPISPLRILDTRAGIGGRTTPLGSKEKWNLRVRGVSGVPSDATAVVLNLTGVGATTATYLTAWAAGATMPGTSNVNVGPGEAVPNLAVVGIGTSGDISLFNAGGSVHVVADLVGFFRAGSDGATALSSLAPSRLLDTRNGTGGRNGALGPDGFLDLQVTGRGGVPLGSAGAVLNVTAVDPTAGTYLTVWPTGETQPTTSSVNAGPGLTVANLVIAKLAANGKVRIKNALGATHVLVDVAGYFGDGTGGRYVSVPPKRIVDTRSGIGAPKAKVGSAPLVVQIRGANGVPASGADAVQINLTAVGPTKDTYLTVYPSGTDLPNSSNLNLPANSVRSNGAIARLGADGKIVVAVGSGASDVLVDVVGYFTT